MLGGLTPVGVAFIVILLIAMIIGISTAVYYSCVAPRIARRRLRKQTEATVIASGSPSIPYSPYADNHRLLTPYMGQDDSLEKSTAIFVKDDADFILSPPLPVFASERKGRFSTATQDGIWWVV